MDYFNQFNQFSAQKISDDEWIVTSSTPHPIYGDTVRIKFRKDDIAFYLDKDKLRSFGEQFMVEIPPMIVIPDLLFSAYMRNWLYKVSGEPRPEPEEIPYDFGYLNPISS